MLVSTSAADVRAATRRGEWRGTTAGHCPANQQANLVILPQEGAVEFAALRGRTPIVASAEGAMHVCRQSSRAQCCAAPV